MPFKIKKTVSSLAPSGNSVLFNGTNQNLRIANNAALQFGTGDFTVDFWLYGNTSQVAYARALSIGGTYGGSQIGLEIDIQGSTGLIMEVNSGASTVTSIVIYSPSTWKNQWNHIAVTRVGTTFYAFYNGTLAGSVTPASINLIGTDGVSIGCSTANANYWNGYISNLRLVKGTALYTASFTPSTTPLTVISGTSLLTCNSATIVDNSTNNFAITNNNTATVSSTVTPFTGSLSPFKIKKNNPNPTMLTGYGASFDGSNNIQTPSNAAFGFGTGDWTIEGWFRASTSTAMKLWRFSDNSDNLDFDLGFSTFGGLGYYNGSSSTYSSAGIITSSIWYHIAAVRRSGTASVYLNGVSVLSQTSTTNSSARSLNVGSAAGSTFNGYISNFRVLKGTALYSASFVPPTSPITSNTSCSLLTCNAATIIDGSSNAFTLTNNGNTVIPSSSFTPFSSSLIVPTNYSVAFNGSNQYLSLPNTSALDLGSNNFTMEAWVYPASVSGNKNIFYINGNNSSYSAICLYVQDSQFAFLANQTGGYPWTLQIGAVGPAISSNTWYHVAATRSGNSFYVFVNGTLVSGAPYTLSGALYNGTTNIIGYQPTVASYFNGYISNARIINGTALYTASFTAPTSPLTAITNTKLLTCNAATIVDGSTNNLTLTNTGAATVSSTITPFSASVSNSGFKLKQVSYVRPNYMVATGGDLITTSGSYKVHTFTTVGTSSFTISSLGESPSIEYLVIGGGGGGGYVAGAYDSRGGGGGAGGFRTGSVSSGFTTSSYSIIVGSGGSLNNNGENSSFLNVTSLGGGGGGFGSTAAKTGGSGGGGGAIGSAGNYSGAAGTAGQGNSGGGGGTDSSTYRYGGGGGGAGSVGVTAINSSTACVGGSGSYSNITGTNTPYAGGGGGGQHAGGIGGGGAGTTTGSANTGGGGGGGYTTYQYANYPGGAGGSGVVILKYRYTT